MSSTHHEDVQVCGNVPVDRATSNIQLLFHYMQKQEVRFFDLNTYAGAPQIDLTAPLQGGDKLRFPHILAVGAPKPLRRLLVTAEYFRTGAEDSDTRYPLTHSP